MGKKELSRLRSVLGKINQNNLKLSKLEAEKKKLKKILKAKDSEIKQLESELKTNPKKHPALVRVGGNYNLFSVTQLRTILRDGGLPQNGNKSALIDRIKINNLSLEDLENELASFSSQESQKTIKKLRKDISKEMKKPHYLKAKEAWTHRKSPDRESQFTTLGIILTIFLVAAGMADDSRTQKQFLEDGFDCENGEFIHGSLVLNGVDDCSNGHDEKDPFWSISDAYTYQSDAENIRWFGSAFVLLICTPLLLFALSGFYVPYMEKKTKKTHLVLDQEYRKQRKPIDKLEMKLNAERRIVRSNEIRAKTYKMMVEKYEKTQKTTDKNKVQLMKIQEESLNNNLEIKRLEAENKEHYDSIKSLIPFSEIFLNNG